MIDCRWCGEAIEDFGPVNIAATPDGRHWRHVSGKRHCVRQMGHIAEPSERGKQLAEAQECCGTCAGGVIARHAGDTHTEGQ